MATSFPSGLFSSPTGLDRSHVINLRWLSILVMSILALFGPRMLDVELPTLLLLAVAVGALAYNLISSSLRGINASWADYPVVVELGIDILAWSLFIGLSGGATNPLISILLPLVAIGAAVLPMGQAWTLGLLSIAAYSLLWQFYLPLVILDQELAVHLHLLGMWMTFAVSVAVTVWFIARMTAAVRERDAALTRAREEALRNDWVVSLGSLAAGAAHELSTPLGTLGTLVEELQLSAELPEEMRSDLKLMQKQVDACKRSLTLLTARAGIVRAEYAEAGSAEVWLRGQVQTWQAIHPATDIAIHISPDVTKVRITPDLSLEQALRNLVDNAISADPRRVQLDIDLESDELVIRISDQGKGIPSKIVKRLDGVPPLSSSQGLGIGLALSKGAIERYAGSIGFRLRPEGGTDTLVRLPLARIAAA